MKTLAEHLIQYAHYHRDQRNIYTHFAGIPLIVIALFSLLSFEISAGITATHLLLAGSLLFYFRLSLSMGLVMLVFSASCYALALQLVCSGKHLCLVRFLSCSFCVGLGAAIYRALF